MIDTVALAFALAMDATAVAATRGLIRRRGEAVVLPLLFGAFQAGMAALGWLGARWGGRYVAAWDHWIAFGLLALVGGKMLVEAWRGSADEAADRTGPLLYLGLAIATSIDAAAAGVTLPTLGVSPGVALAWIGLVTVGCAAAGYALGRTVGAMFGKSLEVLGGVILIALGLRVLVEHLW